MAIVSVVVTITVAIATMVSAEIVNSCIGQWLIGNMVKPVEQLLIEKLVKPVGQLLVKKLVKPIGQWLGYLFHYSSNIENMKKQVKKLKEFRESVPLPHSVDAVTRKIEEIEADDVNKWLENADLIMRKAKEVIEDEEKSKMRFSSVICLNLKHRHQQSKKANKIVQDINEVLNNWRSNEDYMNFGSRMVTVMELMVALEDANFNMIGLWGMPGVGKTTLVREVAKQVKEKKLFDEVAIATVTQSPNLMKIQGEIADKLDLKLDKETSSGRADLLRERLTKDNNKKKLVILDDIWEKLDLDEIGIPRTGCKVVVTSRHRDVLSSEMGTQKDFGLEVLLKEEAWFLFEKLSGDSLKDLNLRSKAVELSIACAGIPLALVTVAKALKNKRLFEWEDALQKLRRPAPGNQKRMQEVIYSAIKLSYNHLEGPELKSFFLFCAQNQGFSSIFYQDVLKKCFGLRLFHGISTLEEARNRTYTLVRSLKDSGLLLDAPDTRNLFRMHNLTRDVALLIAYETQNILTMRDEGLVEWPDEDDMKMCTSIFVYKRDIHELPDRLECPELRCLCVYTKDRESSFKIPDTFFKGMRKLKVLDLTYMRLSSLPSSLMLLTNLKTLCLDQCVLGDIALIGEMKNLEILSLIHSEFKQLPREIGLLTHLRMLDLSNCEKLQVIPANVLSRLILLEELYVGNSFTQWEVEGLNNGRASLAELKHLSRLSTLEVHIPDANMMPEDLLFEKLKRYKIFIGDVWDWSDKHENSRVLKLKLNTCNRLESGIKMLFNGIEYLCLDELNGVKSIVYELDMKGFQQLKHLHVENNTEIKYIIHSRGLVIDDVVFPALKIFSLKNMINLEGICDAQLPLTSFRDIRILKMEDCEKLKFVFSSSIAMGLSQLQELEIKECNIMRAIVVKEDGELEDRDMILFPQLRHLELQCLPKLMSFLSTKNSIITNVGEIIHQGELDFQEIPHTGMQPLFNEEVVFPNLEKMNIYGMDGMKKIWPNQLISDSFGKLETLTVSGCTNLTNIVLPNMLRTLRNLKELKIYDCDSLEEVFEIQETNNVEETRDIAVTELRSLELRNLEKMKHIWSMDPQGIIIFGKLHTVRIFGCSSLKSVFPASVAKALMQLEELTIEDCAVEEIVAKGEEIEWPSLKHLNIRQCDKLKNFGSSELTVRETKVRFPNLERMSIHGRDHLKKIWHEELVPNSFSKLKPLIVERCDSLINIFPRHMLRGLQNLKELQIFNCDSTEDVFVFRGEKVKEISFQLRYLCLSNLPKLQHVWRLDPEVIFTFQNLQEVKVSNCGSLRSLFPVSVAKHLSQLGLLEICDCGLEEIVGMEEGLKTRATFIFPQLRSLILKRLPQLKSFYGGEYKSQWPLLKDLNISNCDKLKSLPVFFLEKDTFPNLEQLKLDWKETMNNQTQCRFPAQFFSKLKVIKLSGAPFEELCGLTSEEQHAGTLEEQYAWTLKRLTVLKLSKMPNLTHLWKENSQLRMALQKLQKLEVSECDGLVNLVPSSMSFRNLQNLVVSKCHGLDCLVTPWTVKSLVRLTKMVIYECKIMKEIVANEGSEEGDDIIFKDLKSLELLYLQSLTSFHSGNCTIKFPSLKELITIECPKLSTSSIPNWKELKQAEKDEPALGNYIAQTKELWDGDLISTIKLFWEDNFDMHKQQKFAEKVPFIPSVSEEKVYIPEAMEDNDFDDVEDLVSQDNTSFPEDFSDRIPSSVNEMSAAHGTSLEETIPLASLPPVVASLVAEKTSVEDNISSCQLDTELPKIIVEEDTNEDGPDTKENVNVCPAADQPVITSNIQQGASTSLLRLAAPTVIQERLDAFLARFDENGTNEHTASHFWIFSGANADWLRFSVPSDSIPLLERLLAKYGDFITRSKLGAGIGNFLLRLLVAIVMDMHNTRLDSLSERKLFEWKNAVKELIHAGLPVEFLLTYLRYIGKIWFTRGLKAQLASFDERIAEVGAKLSALKSEREQLRAIVPETIMHNELVTHELF